MDGAMTGTQEEPWSPSEGTTTANLSLEGGSQGINTLASLHFSLQSTVAVSKV